MELTPLRMLRDSSGTAASTGGGEARGRCSVPVGLPRLPSGCSHRPAAALASALVASITRKVLPPWIAASFPSSPHSKSYSVMPAQKTLAPSLRFGL